MVSLPIFASLWILCVGQEDDLRAQSQSQIPTNVEINTFKVRHEEALLLQVVTEHEPYRFNGLRRMASSRYQSLTGRSQADIAAKLNLYAAEHASVLRVVPCSDLTTSEIASLAQKLKLWTDDEIGLSLPEVDGRQIYADPGVASFFDSSVLHDLQCTEVMKLWAHHIPNSVKNGLSASLILPTVPNFNQEDVILELGHHNKTLSCVAGHTVVGLETLEMEEQDVGVVDWPYWPSNFHFRAKGQGPYPFWQLGPDYTNFNAPLWPINQTFEEMYRGADMEVWHSSAKRATKFYHSSCAWDLVGHQELRQAPCIAIQLGVFESDRHLNEPHGRWLLFTANPSTKSSNEEFCCEATFTAVTNQSLGTINRKFIDNLQYVGNVDFSGHFYNGVAKQYVMAMESPSSCPECNAEPKLPLQVWYETDMEGKPLRFAEIGRDKRFLTDKNLLSIDFPYLYEEMDPTSFSLEPISDAVFDIPEVCGADTIHRCLPGPQNREVGF